MGLLHKKKKLKLQGGGFLKTSAARDIVIDDTGSSVQQKDYMIKPANTNRDYVNPFPISSVPIINREVPVKQDATRVEKPMPQISPTSEPPSLTREEAEEAGLVERKVFSMQDNPDVIDKLNEISPNRFSKEITSYYDQYDDKISEAVNELNSIGETADADAIKAVMLIETGMRPRKNSLGYEGFPQTKAYIVNSINDKYGTNFTMDDMYDPKKSAKFIHYFLKDVNKSMYVNNLTDSLIAYNWGVGNLKKLRRGERSLPEETSNYIKLANILLNK